MSYLLRHPTALGVAFDYPVALTLLVLVAVFLRYRPHPAGPWANRMRALAFASVIATLAGMQITARLPDQRLSLVTAVDLSASVGAEAQDWARRQVATAARALAPGDEMAVLTFAGDVVVVSPPGSPSVPSDLATPVNRTATDIARALDAAVALFDNDGEKRILLLTDGNQTRGDAHRHLAGLRADRIRVDAAIPPAAHEGDVSIDKLVAPPMVTQGGVFPLRIVARNNGLQRPAVLNLFVDGDIINSAAVSVPEGLTTIEVTQDIAVRGGHRVRADLAVASDPIPMNNTAEVSITVSSKTRVLLVTTRKRSLLAEVLGRREVEVTVAQPQHAPREIHDLREYHCVVYEELTGGDLDKPQLDALEGYVRDLGGGFLVVGGTRTFGDVRFERTALRRLLPVTLEPRRPIPHSREPLALVILVDRSNSMGYNSQLRTLRDGQKLRYAKEAAVAVVRQLRDRDLVGVMVFDSRNHVISPLLPLRENRERLVADIPRVVESGGTDFHDALEAAREQLAESRVARRHVILLTDGDTNRTAADHYPLIAEMSNAGISITTIRIGDDTVNLRLLRDISQRTGGEFHHVRDIELLPELMLRDTTRAFGPAKDGEQFLPEVGQENEILAGIAHPSIPPLSGYAHTLPRPGAELILRVARIDRHDPILAVWQFGLGRVAAFTASPGDDAERWPAWNEFGRFWAQLVRWTAPTHKTADYTVEVQRREGSVELTVRTFDPAFSDTVIRARIEVAPDDAREITFTPSGPRVFSARVPDVPPGRYPITVVRRHADGRLSEDTQMAIVPRDEEHPGDEYRSSGPDMALLTRLTEYTGGTINPDPSELSRRRPGTREKSYPLDHILLPLAMLSFLGDIAVRRFRGGAPGADGARGGDANPLPQEPSKSGIDMV